MISEEDELTQDINYCRNPACDCSVPAGVEYCDEYCQAGSTDFDSEYCQPSDIERGSGCRCGHEGCQAG